MSVVPAASSRVSYVIGKGIKFLFGLRGITVVVGRLGHHIVVHGQITDSLVLLLVLLD
jgi:hypothetical protein